MKLSQAMTSLLAVSDFIRERTYSANQNVRVNNGDLYRVILERCAIVSAKIYIFVYTHKL